MKEGISFTEDSKERLYWANELRDYLIENETELTQLGVEEVIVFGSTVRGEAQDDSDLDVNFLLTHVDQSMEDVDYSQKAPAIKEFMTQFLDKKGYRNRDDIHFFVSHFGKNMSYPSHAQDRVSLWSAAK